MSEDIRDCGYDDDGLWFRYRAAAVILHDGHVLMARNQSNSYYYSIGGGVHHGESAVEAVQREVLEETGVRMEVDRLAFIHENFFRDTETAALDGRQCHELAFYFLMKYDASMKLSTEPSLTRLGDIEWHEWIPISQYGVKAVMYPPFFADELAAIGPDPKWITSRD
ncbi:NUDIX hydrolase [Tessaracoccus sp. Y36]|uniref:NUDIX hydrolase n=1 Tax=Tessaracoccus sp. ZS01 TaxID=1906324 RepID=UPI00096D188E|nr:NUDIX domain-containing protein [Tessaracoccus sp. ZS01]MCG6568369.1 NUDIX domain-containing protein [Tessaracoccus sp. ZS01]OMG52777.1 hypothetical protein BJN44_12175 [Tessaracoccus sp. ZS01]